MKTEETFAERIKAARGRESQEIFAGKIGLSRATLSLYERGISQPNADILQKICDITDVSATWLLMGQGPKYPDRPPGEGKPDSSDLPQPVEEHLAHAEARFNERLRAQERSAERERAAMQKSIESKEETIRVLQDYVAAYKELLQTVRSSPNQTIVQEGPPSLLSKIPSSRADGSAAKTPMSRDTDAKPGK